MELLRNLSVQIHAHIEHIGLLLGLHKTALVHLRISLNLLRSVPLGIPRGIILTDHSDVLQILLLGLVLEHGKFLYPPIMIARIRTLPLLPLRTLLHLHRLLLLLLLRVQVLRLQLGSRLRLSVEPARLDLFLGNAVEDGLALLELAVTIST